MKQVSNVPIPSATLHSNKDVLSPEAAEHGIQELFQIARHLTMAETIFSKCSDNFHTTSNKLEYKTVHALACRNVTNLGSLPEQVPGMSNGQGQGHNLEMVASH